MQPYSLRSFASLAFLAGAALSATELAAVPQERGIVSYSISRASQEQGLTLGFDDGTGLAIALADGIVTIDGEAIGRYEPGGDAFRRWETLLAGLAEASQRRSLARTLTDWNPGSVSSAAETELLNRIDRRLEETLAGIVESAPLNARGEEMAERARQAADQAREAAQREVRAAQREVRARTQEVEAAQREVRARTQEVRARTQEVEAAQREVRERERELRARIRDLETRLEARREERRDPGLWSRALGQVIDTTGNVLQALFQFLIACGITLLFTRYAGERVDRVAAEIAERPLRATAVGFAGSVLFVPALILGIAALAVTLIGIVLVPLWVVFFPLAIFLAGSLGYVGMSHNIGRWVLDQDLPWLARIDRNREVHVRLLGLATLTLPFVAAPLLNLIPLTGWLGTALAALGALASAAALMAGLGATILTRGGGDGLPWRRRQDAEDAIDADWSPADVADDGFGEEVDLTAEFAEADSSDGTPEDGESSREESQS